MEISCFSKISVNNNNNHCRNYSQLDIKEKIKILHQINAYNFNKFSFDKSNNNRNPKNKNLNLLSSTLPSSVITKNHVYKKKLVKHNSTKNSPNILVIKNTQSESKSYNRDKIINEIKTNEILRKSVKNELKSEIIKEFLEDIANIDEQKVMNFLKIKNILLSSEKIKNNIFINKNISKDESNQEIITSNILNSSSNENILTENRNFSIKNYKYNYNNNNKSFNSDENENKNISVNKKLIKPVTPIKTIFNNLFINNNEKYIIKNPFHDHDKHLNNINRRRLFIQSNGEIKLSNFNFQIINTKNTKKNSASFDCVYNDNSSIYECIIKKDKDNINKNQNSNIKSEIINNIKSEKELINPEKKNNINNNNININLKKHYFRPIFNREKIKNNKRYEQNSNSNTNLTKDIINNTKSNIEMDTKNDENAEKNNLKKNKKKKKDKKSDKKSKNFKKINLNNNDIKIEDEKRKKLIKKIIEDSKKILQSKNILNDNKYLGNLFILKRSKNKFFSNNKGEILNKSFISRKNKNIKLNQINHHGFNTYSEHKDRNKTFSNFLNDKKSNIFRMCHIKKYFKVLKKDNNKYLLNTKWLKNISKKNTPLLCFDKK